MDVIISLSSSHKIFTTLYCTLPMGELDVRGVPVCACVCVCVPDQEVVARVCRFAAGGLEPWSSRLFYGLLFSGSHLRFTVFLFLAMYHKWSKQIRFYVCC